MYTPTLPAKTAKANSYKVLEIDSPAFKEGEPMPLRHTCDGRNVSPPFTINGIPEKSRSLAIVMEDVDAPNGSWANWVCWNIPVAPHLKEKLSVGLQGMNDYGHHRYEGPCPPGNRHHYRFTIYALNDTLNIPASANKYDLKRAMSEHILATGQLSGTYKRREDPLYLLL